MKISMYMLEHWFHDDQPVIYIEDHTRSIIGARLFTDAVYGQNEYLYVGKMSDFFPQSGSDEVVLVHKRDVMCFESQDLDDIFNRVLAAFDFFEKMEMDMLSGEEEAHPEQCMISACERLLGPTFIMDPSYHVLACSQNYRHIKVNPLWDFFSVNRYPEISSILKMRSSNVVQLLKCPQYMTEFTEPHARPYQYGLISSYAGPAGNLIGHLIIASDKPVTPFEKDLMQIMLEILRVIYSRKAVPERLSADSGEEQIFLTLLKGQSAGQEAKILQAVKGWTEKDVFRILAADPRDISAEILLTSVKASILQAMGGQCILAAEERKIYCLLRYASHAVADTVPDVFSRLPFRAGVSNCFSQLTLCPFYREQALEALKYSRDRITEFKSVALVSVTRHPDSSYKRHACHPLAILLTEYDQKNHTELFHTLCLYLMNERSLRKTAEQLFIHRNTVLYRLEKIYSLYPVDLDMAEERTYLLFSLLLYRSLCVI